MSLADDLAAVPTKGNLDTVKHPPGWEPGLVMSGESGQITTHPTTERSPRWASLLAVWDLDPDEYEVVEGSAQFRAWDAAIGNGQTRRMFYYKANVRRKPAHRADVGELLKILRRRKPRPVEKGDGATFCHAVGDTQLGKVDGDGTAGTIERFRNSLDLHLDHLAQVRKPANVTRVLLPWLGDCLEGNQAQGGALRARLDLTLTEQLRVYRRLMTEQVLAYAGLGLEVIVVPIPGNHDEVERVGGTMSTRYDDSWAVEGAAAVHDALALSGKFDHVQFVFPKRDELTVTVDVSGTVVGMAHGHQFGSGVGGWDRWWAGQAAGRTPIGHAHLLLAGHRHHWHSQDTGRDRTFVQVPALDGGSTWFRHRTGADARPGSVSLVTEAGRWDRLRVG